MADSGVLANVTVLEGGYAQGTLGQASRLKELVRKMTPTKILGEGQVGCVFGGGKALLGEGEHQDCIKVSSLYNLSLQPNRYVEGNPPKAQSRSKLKACPSFSLSLGLGIFVTAA